MKAQDLPEHLRVQAGSQHYLPGQVQGATPHVLKNTAWPGADKNPIGVAHGFINLIAFHIGIYIDLIDLLN